MMVDELWEREANIRVRAAGRPLLTIIRALFTDIRTLLTHIHTHTHIDTQTHTHTHRVGDPAESNLNLEAKAPPACFWLPKRLEHRVVTIFLKSPVQ